MTTIKRISAAILGTVTAVAATTMLGSAAVPKFFTDDPLWVERDTQDASGMKPLELDLMVDLASSIATGMNVPAPGPREERQQRR
jgi:hypothetical protein